MQQFQLGDRVLVTSSDATYDGRHGVVSAVFADDRSAVTGDPRDDYLYRVAFDDAALGSATFRHTALTAVT